MEETLSVSEFKAKCLDLFKRLADRKLDRVTVTRHGKPVALVTTPGMDEAEARASFGSMRGSVIIPPGFDLTAPVFDGEIDAEQGILHR